MKSFKVNESFETLAHLDIFITVVKKNPNLLSEYPFQYWNCILLQKTIKNYLDHNLKNIVTK